MVAEAAAIRGESCENCGADLLGPFCHDCGAPEVKGKDLSLRRFAGEAVEELTSLEHSKLLRTLATLLFRPGRLSREYFSGRRIRYLRPLTLVLAILALHLFAFSASRTVSMYDIGKTAAIERKVAAQRKLPTDGLLAAALDRRAAQTATKRGAIEKEINEQWARNASLSQVPLILLFALVLQIVFLFSRRHVAEHLVFSMHFIAFQVLLQLLAWPIYFVLGVTLTRVTAAIPAIMFTIDILYLFVAIRRFYALRTGPALLRAALAFAGYFLIYLGLYAVAMRLAVGSVLGG